MNAGSAYSIGQCALAIWLLLVSLGTTAWTQSPPVSPERPWHGADERGLAAETGRFRPPRYRIDSDKTYSLAELIDLAEAHNPGTRVAWESARAQSADLGISRSELYPALTAAALSGVDREEVPFGTQYYRQTDSAFQLSLDLSYTILDFGARRGRIDAQSARVLASNFAFNDVHRKLIYDVQQAYYRLLNATAQEAAARASLTNAQSVQQAAEERLQNGLATLPDVLEARSATAQSQYDLQAVLGAEQIARRSGDSSGSLRCQQHPHTSAERNAGARLRRRRRGAVHRPRAHSTARP